MCSFLLTVYETYLTVIQRHESVVDSEDRGEAVMMRTVSTVACCAMLCLACQPEPDLETYRTEILALHDALIQAHIDRNPEFITGRMADEYLSVRDGSIRVLSKAEVEQGYAQYLGSANFSEYISLEEPIIGFSRDGSLAWLIAEVRAAGMLELEDGSEQPLEFTAASLALYERRADGWVRIADAVTFQ